MFNKVWIITWLLVSLTAFAMSAPADDQGPGEGRRVRGNTGTAAPGEQKPQMMERAQKLNRWLDAMNDAFAQRDKEKIGQLIEKFESAKANAPQMPKVEQWFENVKEAYKNEDVTAMEKLLQEANAFRETMKERLAQRPGRQERMGQEPREGFGPQQGQGRGFRGQGPEGFMPEGPRDLQPQGPEGFVGRPEARNRFGGERGLNQQEQMAPQEPRIPSPERIARMNPQQRRHLIRQLQELLQLLQMEENRDREPIYAPQTRGGFGRGYQQQPSGRGRDYAEAPGFGQQQGYRPYAGMPQPNRKFQGQMPQYFGYQPQMPMRPDTREDFGGRMQQRPGRNYEQGFGPGQDRQYQAPGGQFGQRFAPQQRYYRNFDPQEFGPAPMRPEFAPEFEQRGYGRHWNKQQQMTPEDFWED